MFFRPIPVDCHTAGEEVVSDLIAERESNSCLRRSSEASLNRGTSQPKATVRDSNLVVRDNAERRPSFEGNI